MLSLVVRRAWVQRRLLSAVVLLVAVATSFLGFYALQLGVTGPRAFSEQIQRAQPDEVRVTAYAVGVSGSDLEATSREAGAVVRQVLSHLHPSVVSTATSQMRRLGDSDRLGYLATTQRLSSQVTLTSGRWPRGGRTGPVEALAPDAAARVLRLHLGDRLRLGPGPGLGEDQHRARVVIVGTFRGLAPAAAQSDPLSGAGFTPAYSTGRLTVPTFGPFLVGRAAFLSTGFAVEGLRVDAQPDLRIADDASLHAAVVSFAGASATLSARVGTSADITRVASQLPETLGRLHTQEATTRSAVLVALLLGAMLGLAALVLAGRLLADTRARERELLTSLGLGPGQQLMSALVEALLLALTAAILAVPAAATAYAAVTHLPGPAHAQLARGPTVTAGLVMTALAGAVVLTLILVVSPLVGSETGRLAGRGPVAVRLGVDALLLVVATVGWWQLSSRPAAAVGDDTLLTLAPVLCLAAVTIVAVRGLPPVFALVATAGARSRALLPVSLNPAALRLSTGTALVLLSMASAAATFGVSLHATWQRSQGDQAALGAGTDLSLALDAPPTAQDVAKINQAAIGTLVSPVITGPIPLGHDVGGPGGTPQIVAADMRKAGNLLRGRLANGRTWDDIGSRLVPTVPVRGLPLPDGGAEITVVGHAPARVSLSVTPSLVVEDAGGFRSTIDAAPVALDGRPHPLRWSSAAGPGQTIVAVNLAFATEGGAGSARGADSDVTVALRVPHGGGAAATAWQARQVGLPGVVVAQSISVHAEPRTTILTTNVLLHVAYLAFQGGNVLATAFEAPAVVPVAVSQALADATGAKVGTDLSGTVDQTTLPLHVVAIIPNVPSAAGQVAVLADLDTVSRALIVAGHLEPAVDAFWISRPAARTPGALSALGLGDVTSRVVLAGELTRGPLQITVPVAYLTLAGSAVVLLLAGAVLVVSAGHRGRTAEIARLRALGLSRRGARRLVFAQHSILLGALVLTGWVIGAVAAMSLDRHLIRSEQGTAPIPPALLAWPWTAEILLTGGMVLACVVIAAVAATYQVHRSDTTQLQTGEW